MANGESVPSTRRTSFLPSIWSEMDRLWNEMPAIPRLRQLAEERWPAIDVFEREGNVIIKADVPGMRAEDIDVNVTEEGLRISGERTEEKEVKEKDYYRSERTYGRFTRLVPLPAGADVEAAQAGFKDGVLEVTIPLREGAKQRKIDVKAG